MPTPTSMRSKGNKKRIKFTWPEEVQWPFSVPTLSQPFTPPAKEEEWQNSEVYKVLQSHCVSAGADKRALPQFIRSTRSLAYEEGRREMEKIANQTILRLQIVAVELAGRQKDDEAVKIINDIRGKYEELKDALKRKEI